LMDLFEAFILGNGLGAAAFSKTVYQLIVNPSEIPVSFGESNIGVTNTPDQFGIINGRHK
jgi:hypothetical protein